ncbi:MAG: amino acid ABC transporter permease [Verrucomicrobiota bacterium]
MLRRFLILGIAIPLLVFFCFALWVVAAHNYQWDLIANYRGNLFKGWLNTLWISVLAMVLSVAIGIFLTVGQLCGHWLPRILCQIYVEFIRGTPLLTQIMIGYYLIASFLGWNDPFTVGLVILSGFSAAYLSEIFRGGVESIPKSQWNSARAIGLTTAQTYRLIVVPQAIQRVLPASAGQFANLIKDSSLLYVISVHEFTMQAREANANTYATFEAFMPLIPGYLALTIPIFLWSRWLEKRYQYEH